MKTRDETIVRQRAESEELLQNIRSLKEELAEKEGQLRSLQLDLQSAKKQIQHQSQEVGVPGREEEGRDGGRGMLRGKNWVRLWTR